MMFGSSKRAVDAFATQFESDGKQGYLYRRNGRGAGIPVSAVERDAFVRTYRRQFWWLFGGFLVATIIAIVTVTLVGIHFHLGDVLPGFAGPIAFTVILSMGVILAVRHANNAPHRALAGRASVGPERSGEEAREIALARQSWAQIFGILAGFLVAFAHEASRQDVLHGWARLWLVFLALGVGASLYAAVRKWQRQVG